MSMDKSLRVSGRLKRSRNVLRRDERVVALTKDERWKDGQSPYGLPKVRVYRAVVKKKAKEKEAEAVPGAEAAAAATAAPETAPAKPAKGAAGKEGKGGGKEGRK